MRDGEMGDGVKGGEVGARRMGVGDGGQGDGRWVVGWMQPLSRLGCRQGPQLWGYGFLSLKCAVRSVQVGALLLWVCALSSCPSESTSDAWAFEP